MRGGPRKHVCPVCSKSYAKAEHLIRHGRTHTGDKPFVCRQCHRKFSRQDSLARHQQRQGHDAIPAITSATVQDTSNTDLDTPVVNHAGEPSAPVQHADHPEIAAPDSLVNPTDTAAALQLFDHALPQYQTDDLFLPLIWPDSEELLQSILTSQLGPWSENVDFLPGQYPTQEFAQVTHENDSPWLTQDAQQQHENGSHAVQNVSQIVSDLSANVTSEAESAALSKVFLDACLHMFFEQFTPVFPICHRPTFVFRDWTHPLLLNSIALGSLFVGSEVSVAKGEVLWKLAHTAVATSWHSLISHQGPNDSYNGIQLIMTALLGQTYAMLSRTPRLRSTAQIFHSLGFYWARQCDMYNFRRKFSAVNILETNSREYNLKLWKSWSAEEIQLRALLGHYILDGQLVYFTGAPTCQRHASNPLPLPCSQALFQASTLEQWISLLNQEPVQLTNFRQLLLSLFANPPTTFDPTPKASLLTVKVLMEGLESFVSDANSVEGATVGSPSSKAISNALAMLYTYITNSDHFSDEEKTEMLIRWHVVCIDAATNFNSLCRNMCSQYSVEQAVFGSAKFSENVIELRNWIESPRARRSLLHAVAVWDAIRILPVGLAHAIHLPISIFAAATIYLATVLAGAKAVTVPEIVDWTSLLSIDLDEKVSIEQSGRNELTRYLLHDNAKSNGRAKNLLYDSNVFLMYLRRIRCPWGICASLENILEQWLSKCGI